MACDLPGDEAPRRAVAAARTDHGRFLREVVGKPGWPSGRTVGAEASLAALVILLNARSVPLLTLCRPLLAEAVERKGAHAAHLAYVCDLHAVLVGAQQTYGTQVNPATMRPFPIKQAPSVDARRAAVGLPPLATSLAQTPDVAERDDAPAPPPQLVASWSTR
ncbi:DUF6624 domain-containing protein [Streptomyces sp. NPDC004673]